MNFLQRMAAMFRHVRLPSPLGEKEFTTRISANGIEFKVPTRNKQGMPLTQADLDALDAAQARRERRAGIGKKF